MQSHSSWQIRWTTFAGCLALLCGPALVIAAPGPDYPRSFSFNIAYPVDAGVINIQAAPYHARGDGVTDDTAAIQRAINENVSGGILYFPNGTYRVSQTLTWPKKAASGKESWGNFMVQGQSTTGSVIRLKDVVFTNAASPQAIMFCGFFGSADWFHNYIKNISFDTGRGNPGAIGLQFYSNNTGSVRDVAIVSPDGSGAIGLDLGHHDMNGPLLVRNVVVRGFALGIQTGHSVNSQTLENVRIQDATNAGLENNGQSLSIRRLSVSNAPVGIRNASPAGFLTVLDSEFHAGSRAPAKAAVENRSPAFARDLTSSGFETVLQTARGSFAPAASLKEFVSEPPLSVFPSPARSLGLPIKDAPEPEPEPANRWVNVLKFHDAGEDLSPALQKAIDSGATTVYFPVGTYKIGKTVILRGKLQRLTGLNSWLAESAAGVADSVPRFRVEDGESPVVIIENFRAGFGGRPFVEYASGRTLVIRECSGIPSRFFGTGEVYLEDTTASPHGGHVFEGPQKVWAWQFNVENFVNSKISATVENRGSDLWILGLKTEQGNRLVATRKGGRTEILGGLVYTVTPHEKRPAFVIEDSAFSMSVLERCFMGKPMDPVVRETRNGVSRELGQNSVIGLFTGFSEGPPR